MRLATVIMPEGGTHAALERDGRWIVFDEPDVGALIASADWRERASQSPRRLDVENTALAATLPHPAKILCCGLNYRDHIAETGRETPTYPTLFAKFADTLTGPADDIVVVGAGQLDWEAELAVVIGSSAHRAGRMQARQAILGYTVANDISARDWQSRTLQWLQGKAFDGTTPIGPVIVTADEIDPADGLEIGCAINDETVQLSSTAQLVFDSAELVSYISQFTRLSPGDLILTGTPGGVGLGRTPPRYLRDGDRIRTWIQGIGELRNTVVLPQAKES